MLEMQDKQSNLSPDAGVWVVTESASGMQVWQEYNSYDGSDGGGTVWVVTVSPGGMEVWQPYSSYSG